MTGELLELSAWSTSAGCTQVAMESGGEIRRVDPDSGEVLGSLALPAGASITGLEYDGAGRFYAGCGRSGRLRVIRRPR